jgi:type IX secretion system PorP/SprF family membrane protein
MKKYIFLTLMVSLSCIAHGQQLPIYSQYLFNEFMINPAVAGADGYTSFNLTTRQQWIGIKGAPEINSLSFQTRLLKRGYVLKTRKSGRKIFRPQTDGRIGLGGYVYNYRWGLVERTGFQASYVFHSWLNYDTQLSLSMGITGYHFRLKEDEVIFENQDDPVLTGDLRRGIFVPDMVFGAYILRRDYSIGLSADHLLGGIAAIGNQGNAHYKMDRHFYLMGTYSFYYGKNVEIRPSMLLKMSTQVKPQLDIGATYFFDNFRNAYWAGLTYRTGGAIIALVGIRADHVHIGYAFDYSFQEIQHLTYGTHEFTVALKFGDPAKRFRWLRRY